MTDHPQTPPNVAERTSQAVTRPIPEPTHTPGYSMTAALAEKYGPDTAIELTAQLLDTVIPKLGDGLRSAWLAVWRDLVDSKPRQLAAQSGAHHELEFYNDVTTESQ